MSSWLGAILCSWTIRLDVILVLGLLGAACTLGWWRLRRWRHRALATGWRLAFYWAGWAALALALLSGIEGLGVQLFAVHMLQHNLLILVAAPLMALADPFPFFL